MITEFTDLHWEANGLLNIWRRPKVFYNYLAQFQQQDIVFAGWHRLNFWEGDLCTVDVLVSHFSAEEMAGYTLEWNVSDLGVSGVIPDVSVPASDAHKVGTVSFVVPSLDESVRARLHFRLKNPAGKIGSGRKAIVSVPYGRRAKIHLTLPQSRRLASAAGPMGAQAGGAVTGQMRANPGGRRGF